MCKKRGDAISVLYGSAVSRQLEHKGHSTSPLLLLSFKAVTAGADTKALRQHALLSVLDPTPPQPIAHIQSRLARSSLVKCSIPSYTNITSLASFLIKTIPIA
ncbi:Hypothetical protein NTJ_13449 [Nesidiocoris tenuis]|uniref:Uncharacterized protein n=1 Tax=Nesidiocoris tenuis TaxID=355587 RepID=A0ABN7B8B6_9HEMI|nr:Hypothetical protein NTJ_13449 [Nesidiocoris tenuis]